MMFTLRVRWEEKASFFGEGISIITRDQYIRNLSIDKDRAIEKAKLFLDESDILQSDADTLADLNEIRRRESEEVQREREEREAQYEAERNAYANTLVDMVVSGFMPFGMHKGENIKLLPPSYALYWLNTEADDGDIVVDALKKAFAIAFPQLLNLPESNGEYIGNVKERMTFDATCIAVFGFEGFYGWTTIKKFVASTGESLTYMGGGNCPGDIGETVKIKGTIKKHEIYNDEASTYIMRPALVKPKAKKGK